MATDSVEDQRYQGATTDDCDADMSNDHSGHTGRRRPRRRRTALATTSATELHQPLSRTTTTTVIALNNPYNRPTESVTYVAVHVRDQHRFMVYVAREQLHNLHVQRTVKIPHN